MAVKTVKQDSVGVWNSKVFFPKDCYALRCISEENTTSSTGNPMTVNEWEIVNQQPVKIGDSLYDLDGLTFKSYHVTRVNGDEAKSDKCFKQYQERFLIPAGIDCSSGWDDENPPSLKGKVLYASVYGKEDRSYKSPTPEEKAEGKKYGSPMIDPVTGKEVVVYNPQIETVFGLYDKEVTRPF